MIRFSTIFAAALVCAFTAPVVAQAVTGNIAVAMADHATSASKLVGMNVFNEQNQNIGSIVDVLVKNQSGEATAIISVGDFVGGGAKFVAVPLGHVTVDGSRAAMAGATRQALAAMPSYRSEGLLGGGG